MHRPTEDSKLVTKKIVICGAGPGGLATALKALELNVPIEIIIIESRKEEDVALRTQLLIPTPDTRTFLIKTLHVLDPVFIKIIKAKGGKGTTLAIKDIQRALLRRLEEEKSCTFMFNTQVSKVDMERGEISIVRGSESKEHDSPEVETIPFDDLIDATGSHHAIANLLKGTPHEITFDAIPSRINLNHLMGYFKLKDRLGKDFKITHGISTIYLPNQYMCFTYPDSYSNKEGYKIAKFNVLTMIADSINIKGHEQKTVNHEEAKRAKDQETQEGIEYLKNLLQFEYPMCDVEFTASKKNAKKDPLKIQFFQTTQFEARTTFVKAGNKSLILVGDAVRTPDFYQGHGLHDAIMHAIMLLNVFSGKHTLEDYHKYCKDLTAQRTEDLLVTDIDIREKDTDFLKEIIDNRLTETMRLTDVSAQERDLLISLKNTILDVKAEAGTGTPDLKLVEAKIISIHKEMQKINQGKSKPSSAFVFINAIKEIWNSKYNGYLDSRSLSDKIQEQKDVLKKYKWDQMDVPYHTYFQDSLKYLDKFKNKFGKKESKEFELYEKKKHVPPEPTFIQAVRQNNIQIIKELIKDGRLIDARNHHGDSALIVALRLGHYAIAKELILAKANVNFKGLGGDTALHLAAAGGQIELVNLLIEHGAGVKFVNHLDKNYLFYLSMCILVCYEQKQYEKIPLVFAHKNDLDLTCTPGYCFSLSYSVKSQFSNAREALVTLMTNYIESGNLLGLEQLKHCIHPQTFLTLVNQGDGHSLVYRAHKAGQFEIEKWFVAGGAKPHATILLNYTAPVQTVEESKLSGYLAKNLRKLFSKGLGKTAQENMQREFK